MYSFSACDCNATGSSSLQCADSTGQCTCNAGYKGTNCDAACGCDATGSSSTACDASTGQCTCNSGYSGTTCNTLTCATNFYKESDGSTCTGQYNYTLETSVYMIEFLQMNYFQPVIVMALVLAVCNVLIQLASVHAMLVTRVPNVMLFAVVTPLVQVAHLVISHQVNVLAILDTQEPHVILVPPITIEQVMEHVQVRVVNFHCLSYA